MNKLLRHLSFLLFCLIAANPTFAHTDFLTGIAHTQLSSDFTYNTAGAAALEVGPRNYRLSGTLGWALNPNNRFKITGEWLWQNLKYSFITSTTREWMQQGAVGLGYQMYFYHPWFHSFDLSGYYSHAPSKSLIAVDYLDIPSGNILTDVRRIAGSHAGGVSPGVTVSPWCGADAQLALNWDKVTYDNKHTSKTHARGFGGTVGLTQVFHVNEHNFQFTTAASIRSPFDYYHNELDWIRPFYYSELLVGVFGDYTHGKKSLTSTAVVGLNVSYAIDAPAPSHATVHGVTPDSLLSWTSVPAVYMPRVLAVVDDGVAVCPPGSAPTFRGTAADLTLAALPIDFSKRFTGNGPLRFSLTKSSGDATINPTTGVLTATTPSTNIVITATGPCGGPAHTNSFNITAS